MSYFKTSSETLQRLAKRGRYEEVAGFLVLARHATGYAVAGFEPYKLSGAGVNSIHEKAGISEETARGVIEALLQEGFIKPVSPVTQQAFRHARWEIVQGELDLALPHAITDALKPSGAASALRRVRDVRVAPAYVNQLKDVSTAELRLDALMVLLGVYRNTHMERFGGLDPHCCFRQWQVKSLTAKAAGVRWGAEPTEHSERAFTSFMQECLQHVPRQKSKEATEALVSHRYWSAWFGVKASGLVYEAVALYDVPPLSNQSASLRLTLRVNDYHAGASANGDPSFLKHAGTGLGYYTPAVNEREEPEAMWVVLPDKRGDIIGIWRPRFRASTPDVGAWHEHEEDAISETLGALVQAPDHGGQPQ